MLAEEEESTGKLEEEETLGKAEERSLSPGGTWAKMVKHSKINPNHASPGQSTSQESQETARQGPSQATRGIKSQRKQREQDTEKELELGRQLFIEEIGLL